MCSELVCKNLLLGIYLFDKLVGILMLLFSLKFPPEVIHVLLEHVFVLLHGLLVQSFYICKGLQPSI
jgi:hypothetical protein